MISENSCLRLSCQTSCTLFNNIDALVSYMYMFMRSIQKKNYLGFLLPYLFEVLEVAFCG